MDPLICPRCGGAMKIVSFIEPTQPDVIDRTLTHCGLLDESPRALPQPTSAAPGDLRCVSDLQYVDDPGPQEPACSTD